MGNLLESTSKNFIGKWESISLEKRPNPWGGNFFLKRYFHNTAEQAHAKLVFFTDETGNALNMTLEVIGPYIFLKPSAAVERAVEADFDFTTMAATPHSQAMVDMLNTDRPGYFKEWKAGLRQEINTIGQALMGIVLGSYKEYDLVKVEDGKLYYGARPADGSGPDSPEKRATSLQVPLKRVE